MKISLVGGSNTGMLEGYSKHIIAAFPATQRCTLGASTSLTGLANISLKNAFKNCDAALFEYALNDISFHRPGHYHADLLERTLSGVCHLASQDAVPLLFVLMVPRYALGEALSDNCPVLTTYRRVAERYNVPWFDVTEFLLNSGHEAANLVKAYTDDSHYRMAVAAEIGKECIRLLRSNVPRPPRAGQSGLKIHLVKADEIVAEGNFAVVERTTSMFGGRTLRLEPGGNIFVGADYDVLGLISNTMGESGVVTVQTPDAYFAKNLFDGFYKENQPRFFLKQFDEPLKGGCRISCGVAPDIVSSLPYQKTLHERPPLVNSGAVAMEIAAIVAERKTEVI